VLGKVDINGLLGVNVLPGPDIKEVGREKVPKFVGGEKLRGCMDDMLPKLENYVNKQRLFIKKTI